MNELFTQKEFWEEQLPTFLFKYMELIWLGSLIIVVGLTIVACRLYYECRRVEEIIREKEEEDRLRNDEDLMFP